MITEHFDFIFTQTNIVPQFENDPDILLFSCLSSISISFFDDIW